MMKPTTTPTPRSYKAQSSGFLFRLEPEAVAVLRTVPDFDAREEPAVAEDFLRARAEAWAEALTSAGAPAGEYDVRLEAHQRRALLCRDNTVVFAAEI
jgi:hypothetical protein